MNRPSEPGASPMNRAEMESAGSRFLPIPTPMDSLRSPHVSNRRFRVLFLCVHNSARSQLAEGLLRAMASERFDVFSAGSEPSFVHPLATKVLQERGIDASQHRSKSVQKFAREKFDYAITLCAEEVCPVFLGATQKLHWALADPAAQPENQLSAFRQTADELENRLRQFIKEKPGF